MTHFSIYACLSVLSGPRRQEDSALNLISSRPYNLLDNDARVPGVDRDSGWILQKAQQENRSSDP